MPLAPLVGHADLRTRFARAIAANRLPQVLLLTGPSGVGKQRLALWLAERLLCQSPAGDEPCGTCASCLKVRNLAHPDVHWFVPVPRPKAGDSDKQVEEVAELLEQVMAERRASGAWSAPDGMALHGIASARLLQRRAALTAAEGGRRVFIIGRAERLVPQESSQEAANALLKLLEEPPVGAVFILTTAEPGLVLPTIRSRAIPVRVPRLSPAETAQLAPSAAPESGKAAAQAEEFLRLVGRGPAERTERALRQGPWQARGEFTELLDALAVRLAMQARQAATGTGRTTAHPMALTEAVEKVLATREQAQGNVNPQLLLAVLAEDLAALEVA